MGAYGNTYISAETGIDFSSTCIATDPAVVHPGGSNTAVVAEDGSLFAVLTVAVVAVCLSVVALSFVWCRSGDFDTASELHVGIGMQMNFLQMPPPEKLFFGSMRFPPPPEAVELQKALADVGITLKIVDMKAGGDIDKEVFSWLSHADYFVVFGTKRYGEDTGNPACTYHELKYAQCKRKTLVLIRMIPWDEEYDEMAADVLFNQNYLTLDWQPGTPMPPTLIPELLKLVPEQKAEATQGSAARDRASMVFDFLDKDDNGYVDAHEITTWGEVIRGKHYTSDEARAVIHDIADDNDLITLKQWLAFHEASTNQDHTFLLDPTQLQPAQHTNHEK